MKLISKEFTVIDRYIIVANNIDIQLMDIVIFQNRELVISHMFLPASFLVHNFIAEIYYNN